MRPFVLAALIFCFCASASSQAAGQDQPTPDTAAPPTPALLTASHDEAGGVVLRAFRLSSPIVLDGKLDEDVYETIEPASDFIQQEPHEGDPATERTDAWILFDDDNLYVAARCWDSQPDRIVANEMRRDGNAITRNDNFVVVFDTYHDRRNGFYFQTNPLSALRDQSVTDEGNQNQDWNTVWDVRSARFAGGWTLEMVIPFKSLRYKGGGPQTWGINMRRLVASKNEMTFITRVPAAYGPPGIYKFSSAATLVGLETPAQSVNLEVKPYAISTAVTDTAADVPYTNDVNGKAGFDVKYGLTRSLIADFTYNTDFAQVEDDMQQVNLTRFSLFYPEKRDFFLEGQGIFSFGSLPRSGGPDGGGGNAGDQPLLFFSRRIGLVDGITVPVRAGGRVTGKTGKYTIGALNVQTGDSQAAQSPAENFSVVRVKRDLFRRSNVGVIATRRAPAVGGQGSNLVLGADGNLVLSTTVAFSGYYAQSDTPGRTGNDATWRTQFNYDADRYGANIEHLRVGPDFNPEVGFLRREDFRRTFARARFSPRPQHLRSVRKINWEAGYERFTNGNGTLVESRETTAQMRVEMQNGDNFSAEYAHSYEFLTDPFAITSHVTIPVGAYGWSSGRFGYMLGQQRKISGRLSFSTGGFYDGTRQELGYGGRIEVTPRIAVEPNVTLNWVDLAAGRFTTRLVSTRLVLTPSARSVLSGLLQFNADSHVLTSNFRYRWEYRPGSEIFVVYSDGRDTAAAGFPDLQNRSLAVKITRLMRL